MIFQHQTWISFAAWKVISCGRPGISYLNKISLLLKKQFQYFNYTLSKRRQFIIRSERFHSKIPFGCGARPVLRDIFAILYVGQTLWGAIVSVQDILGMGEQNSVAGVGNLGDSLYFPRNTSDRISNLWKILLFLCGSLINFNCYF